MARDERRAPGAHADRSAERAREARRAQRDGERRRAEAQRVRDQELRAAERGRKRKRSRRKWKKALRSLKITLIVLLVLAVLAAVGMYVLGRHVSTSETNLPNVFLNGIDVSRLTPEQTLEKLNEAGWDEEAAVPLTVELPMNIRMTLDRREAGTALSAETAAAAAYRYGHSPDWFENLRCYLGSYRGRADVVLDDPEVNETYVRSAVTSAVADFDKAVSGDGEAVVDKEKAEIRCIKGAGALHLDSGAVLQAVTDALCAGETSLRFDKIEGEAVMPDFDALFRELNVSPVNAYFVEGGFDVVDEIVGCSFNVPLAKETWRKADLMEEVVIPLVITEPEVTGESLRGLLYRDVLGYQTTVFASSGENRINNIKLAASKINGVILMPGETFSYNETIGQRTKEAGFLEAGAYADGEVVQEVGGGICQVSSTLYCATLFANLETVSRTNHYFRVDYLPIAYDATVSWPKPDFQFRNNREYPIKIVAYTDDDKNLTVEIHGTNVDGSHVELTNVQYVVNDTTYPNVIIGWGARAYRHVYDANGTEIAVIEEPYGIYNKHAEDIDWPPEYYAAKEAAEAGESAAVVVNSGETVVPAVEGVAQITIG